MNKRNTNQEAETGAKTLSAIVYARTSGGDDREDKVDNTGKVSHLVQLEQGNKLAKVKGYNVILEATDVHRSSRTYPSNAPRDWVEKDTDFTEYYEKHIKQPKRYSRDGLSEVMKALPKADRLIVRDITRLARPFRSSYLLNYLFQKLRENNVTIETTTGMIIEPTDNMAKMVAGMVLSIEDDSLQTKNEGHIQSIIKKRDSGSLYMAVRCLGYRTANQKVRKIDSEANVVRSIFDMFLEDKGIHAIVRTLNDTIKAKTVKNTNFTVRSVKVILRNLFYAGYHLNSEGETLKANYLTGLEIVSLEDWKLAQAKLSENNRYTSVKINVHPLSGLVYCGYCGIRLYVKAGNNGKDWYYGCGDVRGTDNATLGCRKVNIIESVKRPFLRKANAVAFSGLVEALRPLLASQILSHLGTANGASEYRTERDNLTIEIEALRQQEEEVNGMLRSKTIGMEQFKSLTIGLKADRDKLQARQAELSRAVEEQEITSSIEWSKLMATGTTPVTERRMFNATIDRVDVYAYHVRVTLKEGSTLLLERFLIGNKRHMPEVSWHYNAERMEKPQITYNYGNEIPKYAGRVALETESVLVRVRGYAKAPSKAKALLEEPETFKAMYNAPLSEDDSRRL